MADAATLFLTMMDCKKNLIFLWLIGEVYVIILYSEQCQIVREFLSEPERRKEVVIVSR